MTSKIWAITTHHKRTFEAAEEWKRLGICAIGWTPVNFTKCRKKKDFIKKYQQQGWPLKDLDQIYNFVREIRKGDIVLAYALNNTIAYVGEVKKGRCKFVRDNVIGSEKGFGYPHQRRVRWWNEPFYFDRRDLPPYFTKQLGKRGISAVEIFPDQKGFEGFIKVVHACANSGSKLPSLKEDLIKAGLVKYLYHSLDKLEPGLKIEHVEVSIGKQKRSRPDFIAKDKRGRTVLIECKGIAGEKAIEQIKDYEKRYGRGKKSRLMLVAFKIKEACKPKARKENIELIECDLSFKKRAPRG